MTYSYHTYAMDSEERVKQIVSENLIYYRKRNNLTQAQAAELISYSDKAISKWERGEALPDVYVLLQLAEVYQVRIEDLLNQKKKKREPNSKRAHILISLLSAGIVWLVATIAMVIILSIGNYAPNINYWAFMPFIYAIPVSSIVLLVFANLWGPKWLSMSFVSLIIWGVALSLNLSLRGIISWSWLFYIICIPLEILTLLWYLFLRRKFAK